MGTAKMEVAPTGYYVKVDVGMMTRLAEVVEYADDRNITVRAAIIELVNNGLSFL